MILKNLSIPLWSGFVKYEKNDCVVYENNYYFCLKGNIGLNPEESLKDYWIDNKTFVWEPTFSAQSTSQLNNKFTNLIPQSGATLSKKNSRKPSLLVFDLNFNDRYNSETKSILTFLESNEGAYSFDFFVEKPYNSIIRCKCVQWSHTYNFLNDNTITARFEEIK